MVAFSSLVLAGSAIAGASANLGHRDSLHKRLTTSSTGTSGGYYYSFWTEESTGVDYENGDDGEYSVTWESSSIDFVAGKGWDEGSSDRSITFDADFSPDGNAYLSVYGWTTNPLVEYYITENYGDYDPASQLTYVGSVTSDGSAYDVYKTVRTDASSIEGDGATFNQYWSIRQDLRSSGTVTVANHFAAWESLGLTLGGFSDGAYQIVATEGYESSGSSTVTVSS